MSHDPCSHAFDWSTHYNDHGRNSNQYIASNKVMRHSLDWDWFSFGVTAQILSYVTIFTAGTTHSLTRALIKHIIHTYYRITQLHMKPGHWTCLILLQIIMRNRATKNLQMLNVFLKNWNKKQELIDGEDDVTSGGKRVKRVPVIG